ncbi:MAG: hypothetical protein ACYCOU_23405 [Sulfobacillus sp.]
MSETLFPLPLIEDTATRAIYRLFDQAEIMRCIIKGYPDDDMRLLGGADDLIEAAENMISTLKAGK